MEVVPTLLTVAVTLAIVVYILAYTNIYEHDVKPILKNEAYFAGNFWSTNLKKDKDYDGYVNHYKSTLCAKMNAEECQSTTVSAFCEYDESSATCTEKYMTSGDKIYKTDDYDKATTKLHKSLCSEIPLSVCKESSSHATGFCEVEDGECVPRSSKLTPSPATAPASAPAPAPAPMEANSPSFQR
tara:strand:+ start:22453 stop:23007 length:555 start_codon:yes stop_codon:yes gene_type:complete